jgi:hypothetical protein
LTAYLFSAIPLAERFGGVAVSVNQHTDRVSASLARNLLGEMLVWIGIVGAALTIIARWSTFVVVAGWFQEPILLWTEWLHSLWNALLFWVQAGVSREVSSFLSLLLFYLILALGLNPWSQNRSKAFSFVGTIAIAQLSSLPITLLLFYQVLRYHIGFPNNAAALWLWAGTGVLLSAAIADGSLVSRAIFALLLLSFLTVILYLFDPHFAFMIDSAGLPPGGGALVRLLFYYMLPIVLTLPIAFARTDDLIRPIALLLFGVIVIFGVSEVSRGLGS